MIRSPWWVRLPTRMVLEHPFVLLVFLLFLTCVSGWRAARNTFDHDLRDLLDESQRSFAPYERCIELFGPDDDIFIAMPIVGLGTESLRQAILVREAVGDLPGTARVFDLAAALGLTTIEKLDYLRERPRLLERRLRELSESTSLRGLLLGREGKAQTVVVRSEPLSNEAKQDLVRAIRRRLEERFPGGAFHLSGYQVFGERFIWHTIRGNRQFLGLSLAFSLLMAWLLFRSVPLTIVVLVAIFLPAVWTHGLYAGLGYRLTLYSTLLTPIILFVGLSLAIQFIARFRLAYAALGGVDVHALMLRSLGDALPPGFLCAFTTLLGFASQVLSPLPGIRAFGIFSSIGCGFVFLSVFLVLPLALGCFPRLGAPVDRTRDFGWNAGRMLARCSLHPKVVVTLMLAASLLFGGGIPRLCFGSDPLRALPADDPAVTGFAFFSRHFAIGERQISLLITSTGPEPDFTEGFARLEAVERRLASDPDVLSVLGPGRIIEEVHRTSFGPLPVGGMTSGDVDRAIRFAEKYSGSWLGGFLNSPFHDRARIMIGLRHPDAPRVVAAAKRLERLVREASDEVLVATATGRMLLSAVMEQEALTVEVGSFLSSLAGILAVIGIGFSSWRTVIVAAVPNVLPIVWTLGLLGWLGESLDTVTAMVPCICLGIVVDDTIHLIHETQRFERRGYGWRRLRAAVMIRIGWAVFSTSLILVAGLAILGWSDFRPIRGFGLFAAVTIGFAPLFDLFLTPALLALTAPKPSARGMRTDQNEADDKRGRMEGQPPVP